MTGPYKSYYENGQLRSEGEYLNEDLNGVYKTYTPKGQLATEEIYQAGMLSYQKIYWQAIPYEGGFLFVSNTGYEKIKNGQYIDSGNLTPDNIIEEKLNPETGSLELYIWNNGQKNYIKNYQSSKAN